MTPDGLLLPGGDLRTVADQVAATVSGQYTVRRAPVREVTRSRLDSADLRLAAKGMRLLLERTGTGSRLTLTRPGRRALAADAPGLSVPALVDELPDGRLREAVRKPLSVRALLPQAEERRSVQDLGLSRAGRLAVRVEVDAPETGTSTLVTVEPLRGHERDGDRVYALLARLPGATVAEPVALPQPAAPPPPAFTAATPAPQAVAELVSGYLAEMRATVDGVVEDLDTEFLHDFRVALRRTRSTLKLSRKVLDPATVARHERDAKRLADLTTHLRDLDVHLLGLPRMRGRLTSADPGDLGAFERHVRRRRAAEHRRLARAAATARVQQLLGDWTAELVRTAGAKHSAVTAEEHSRRLISRAHRRVLRAGSAVTDESPPEHLHTVRKRCKELRYALEMFASLHDPRVTQKAVSDLKKLQDCLGRFQDAHVQQAVVRRFAEEMAAAGPVDAPALLAMGELVAHLEADQQGARQDFGRAFARFAESSATTRIGSLGTHGDR